MNVKLNQKPIIAEKKYEVKRVNGANTIPPIGKPNDPVL